MIVTLHILAELYQKYSFSKGGTNQTFRELQRILPSKESVWGPEHSLIPYISYTGMSRLWKNATVSWVIGAAADAWERIVNQESGTFEELSCKKEVILWIEALSKISWTVFHNDEMTMTSLSNQYKLTCRIHLSKPRICFILLKTNLKAKVMKIWKLFI